VTGEEAGNFCAVPPRGGTACCGLTPGSVTPAGFRPPGLRLKGPFGAPVPLTADRWPLKGPFGAPVPIICRLYFRPKHLIRVN
jgi:hypothetical protein